MSVCALLVCSCASGQKESAKAEPAAQAVVKKSSKPKRTRVTARRVVETPPPAPRSETGMPRPFVPQMPGKRVAQVSVPGPYVALTFDDGPSAANTPKVLDILKRHNAKATFFVLGQLAVSHKGILARAVAEGHEIGAHTWSHIQMSASSDERIISEMDRTNAAITEATGRRPVIMRPPYGATNKRVLDLMASRYGMTSILWDVDTQDWKHPGVGVVTERAVSRAHNGSIILLHDIHASTLAAVEGIVTGLQRRGFKLVTVSELIELGRGAASHAGLAAEEPAAPPAAQPAKSEPPAAPAATAVVASPAAAEAAPAAPANAPADSQPTTASPTQEL